ncbi:MAG: adenosylcobinamide-GDP ribazoletransferase [Parasporobacterium sp.]|nr:adenosylcobinamide-GDP ribazoletransferase [Parasporobacterium sp.]
MKVLRALAIAFSTYSKIPMPQFEWTKEDMKHVISFFPCVGLVIGFFECIWFSIAVKIGVGDLARAIIAALIPVFITGGFHVDGFMDTSDAIYSYKDREKRLEILKDSNVGAFAVIRLLAAAGLAVAAMSEIRSVSSMQVLGLGFVLSRALSAMGVLHFRSATKKGSLFYTASNSDRIVNTLALCFIIPAATVLMIIISPVPGLMTAAGAFLSFLFYRIMSYRKFGGITGDTAGYFVTLCEVVMMILTAAGDMICR